MDMPVARTRRPAVAGYFYAEEPAELAAEVDACLGPRQAIAARGLITPHDSYARSGRVAGAAFGRVAIPRRCIVIGPSHTNAGLPWRLMINGAYRTPLGDVPVDEALAQAWQARCPWLAPETATHLGEHAIEVQVPFLQRLGPDDLTLVPLIVGTEDWDETARTAHGLAQAVRLAEEPVLIIGTSDLSHYEPDARTRAQDQQLLEAIAALDGAEFLRRVRTCQAVVCGNGVIALVLEAVRALGATRADCVAYATSAQAGGDPEAAVGYAGVILQ